VRQGDERDREVGGREEEEDGERPRPLAPRTSRRPGGGEEGDGDANPGESQEQAVDGWKKIFAFPASSSGAPGFGPARSPRGSFFMAPP